MKQKRADFIRMIRIEKLSIEEIAKVLGVTPLTVRRNIRSSYIRKGWAETLLAEAKANAKAKKVEKTELVYLLDTSYLLNRPESCLKLDGRLLMPRFCRNEVEHLISGGTVERPDQVKQVLEMADLIYIEDLPRVELPPEMGFLKSRNIMFLRYASALSASTDNLRICVKSYELQKLLELSRIHDVASR